MSSERAQQLLAQLRLEQANTIRLLQHLVEAESPSRDSESQQVVLNLLSDELTALDYRLRRIPDHQTGGYLLGVPGSRRHGQPIQLLVGHCDTVWPRGTLDSMPITMRAGKMTGPGIFDMKGGLAQIISSLRALRASELEPEVAPVVLVNSYEEIGSNRSRGMVRRLAKTADRVLVLEPAFGRRGKLKTARKGVGQFTVKVRGRAAHAGLEPSKGVSAILELSLVVQKLFALNDPDRGISVNVGTIDGGMRSNVVAPTSEATVDVRVMTLAQAAEIETALRSLTPETPGAELEIEGGFPLPPMEPTPRNQTLWNLAVEVGRELDLELRDGLAGGGSDGNVASLYAPTLDGLGPTGDGAHAPHEHVVLDSLIERGALLALILLAPPIRRHDEDP